MGRSRELAELASAYDGSSLGFRNRIINGDMRIDQRNAGASVTPNNVYTLDRWLYENAQASKASVQQNAGSVTPPAGFTNYLGVTSLSAYASLSTDYFVIAQKVEGFNVADLGWGSAGAQSVALSFWVRSSLTGTHSGAFVNNASNRSYSFTFTVSAANTWEYKTIIVPGDTTGSWLTTNGAGIVLRFNLGSGSGAVTTAGSWLASNSNGASGAVSVVGTNGATFYITGVQLEAGSVATPFERRDYGRELMMCQRYYEKTGFILQTSGGTTNPSAFWKVDKRTTPTLTLSIQTGSGGTVAAFNSSFGETTGFYQNANNSSQSNSIVSGSAEL